MLPQLFFRHHSYNRGLCSSPHSFYSAITIAVKTYAEASLLSGTVLISRKDDKTDYTSLRPTDTSRGSTNVCHNHLFTRQLCAGHANRIQHCLPRAGAGTIFCRLHTTPS
jgi:hypothetical protein